MRKVKDVSTVGSAFGGDVLERFNRKDEVVDVFYRNIWKDFKTTPTFSIEMELFLKKFAAEVKICLDDIDPADRRVRLYELRTFIRRLFNCYYGQVERRDEETMYCRD